MRCNRDERSTLRISSPCRGLGWPSVGVSARAPDALGYATGDSTAIGLRQPCRPVTTGQLTSPRPRRRTPSQGSGGRPAGHADCRRPGTSLPATRRRAAYRRRGPGLGLPAGVRPLLRLAGAPWHGTATVGRVEGGSMGLLTPRCPVADRERDWIHERMAWLRGQFGDRPLSAPVILPTSEYFPPPYSGSDADIRAVVVTVAGFMGVRARVEVEFSSDIDHMQNLARLTAGGPVRYGGAAGTYSRAGRKGRHVI